MNEWFIASVKKLSPRLKWTPLGATLLATAGTHSGSSRRTCSRFTFEIHYNKHCIILAAHILITQPPQNRRSPHKDESSIKMDITPHINFATPKLKRTRCAFGRHDSSPYQTCHLLSMQIIYNQNRCRCRCMTPHNTWRICPV
jgi:hypothetical protein